MEAGEKGTRQKDRRQSPEARAHAFHFACGAMIHCPEKKAWEKAIVMPQLPNTCMTVQFSHIMAGGYAAGYYSYKWAEVLDADAFSVFKKNGIFDQATAQSFRDNILSKGGTEHPMTLYKRFRGQEPTIDALLERNEIKRNVESK